MLKPFYARVCACVCVWVYGEVESLVVSSSSSCTKLIAATNFDCKLEMPTKWE